MSMFTHKGIKRFRWIGTTGRTYEIMDTFVFLWKVFWDCIATSFQIVHGCCAETVRAIEWLFFYFFFLFDKSELSLFYNCLYTWKLKLKQSAWFLLVRIKLKPKYYILIGLIQNINRHERTPSRLKSCSFDWSLTCMGYKRKIYSWNLSLTYGCRKCLGFSDDSLV